MDFNWNYGIPEELDYKTITEFNEGNQLRYYNIITNEYWYFDKPCDLYFCLNDIKKILGTTDDIINKNFIYYKISVIAYDEPPIIPEGVNSLDFINDLDNIDPTSYDTFILYENVIDIMSLCKENKNTYKLFVFVMDTLRKLINTYMTYNINYNLNKFSDLIEYLSPEELSSSEIKTSIDEANNKLIDEYNKHNKNFEWFKIKGMQNIESSNIDILDINTLKKQHKIADNFEKHYNCTVIKQFQQPYVLFLGGDIQKILKYKFIRKTVASFDNKLKQIIKTKTAGGMQCCVHLTYLGLLKLLSSSRKEDVMGLIEKCEIDIDTIKFICVETDILSCISKTFKNEKISLQYRVFTYKIDLYFDDYNLAIECDETHTDIKIDLLREEKIKNEIGCKFIRFKPFDKKFDIFVLLNEIFEEIKKGNVKRTSSTGKSVEKRNSKTHMLICTWNTIAKAAEDEKICSAKLSRSIKAKTIFNDEYYYSVKL